MTNQNSLINCYLNTKAGVSISNTGNIIYNSFAKLKKYKYLQFFSDKLLHWSS